MDVITNKLFSGVVYTGNSSPSEGDSSFDKSAPIVAACVSSKIKNAIIEGGKVYSFGSVEINDVEFTAETVKAIVNTYAPNECEIGFLRVSGIPLTMESIESVEHTAPFADVSKVIQKMSNTVTAVARVNNVLVFFADEIFAKMLLGFMPRYIKDMMSPEDIESLRGGSKVAALRKTSYEQNTRDLLEIVKNELKDDPRAKAWREEEIAAAMKRANADSFAKYENESRELYEEIKNYYEQIVSMSARKRDVDRILSLKSDDLTDEQNEFAKALSSYRNISGYDVEDGSNIIVSFKTPLVCAYPEDLVNMFDRSSSILYETSGPIVKKITGMGVSVQNPKRRQKVIKAFYESIFINRRFDIIAGAAFKFAADGGSLRAQKSLTMDMRDNCMPNMHIGRFSCIGGYADQIAELSSKRDIMGLLHVASSSSGSISFTDGAVLPYFVEAFASWDKYGKCVVDNETHEHITVGDMYMKMKEEGIFNE